MFRFDPTFLKLQKLIKMGEAGQSRDGESVTPLVGGGNGDNAVAPQVFNSLPALNEAASYITQATSYLGSCFSDYSGTLSFYLLMSYSVCNSTFIC
jgi:hypothetical protein